LIPRQCLATLLLLLSAVSAEPQTTAGQAPAAQGSGSPERTEIPDPMQIEVSLGADKDIRGKDRPSFDQMSVGTVRSYPETDRFVCDQARVRMLTVKKVEETESEVVITVSPTLVSEWPMQDVDLAVSLISAAGEEVTRRFWDNLTLGAWSRSYTPPKAELRIPADRWRALFAEGSAPKIRLVVDIQE
jgi:hypothetical protein